eukprot:jgi/Botrbrau1/20438/Bobra.145_2s0003.1
MLSEGRKSRRRPVVAASSDAVPSTSDVEESTVIYIGHLPHGFYEEELKAFFSQFGTVTKVRVSRNKKTGKAKHYAFLEFEFAEVADIAAKAMHNYMMFKQKLEVSLVPPERIHPDMWKGANKKFKPFPFREVARDQHNAPRTLQQQAERQARLVKRDSRRKKRIAEADIEYEYKGLSSAVPPKPKKIKFDD